MRTIDSSYSGQINRLERLKRDVRLLWRIARMLYSYLVEGHRIRKRLHDKEARGEIFYVDEDLHA
ncbi:MAG: hypothetical protein D6737_17570 [Chloroflexi bacterium]|nr:MAG: hypothetical protein D6737_17570 [Chloroflexota bacterium]